MTATSTNLSKLLEDALELGRIESTTSVDHFECEKYGVTL